MPGRDGTGPFGQGPMTGRCLGPCGRGFRRGHGFGRGFGWNHPVYQYQQTYVGEPVELSKEEQKKILQEELKEIDIERQQIEKKLKEL